MSIENVHYFNILVGLGAIVLQGISVIALLLLLFKNRKNAFFTLIEKNFLTIGFVVALAASLISLFYSDVIGFPPCHLCWLQRIFLYPLVFIFGMAIWTKDRKVLRYVAPLLIVGAVIAVYHNIGYYFGETGSGPCDATGVSCYQHLVSEFGGYISIPMLSLTAFFALLTLCLVVHFQGKEQYS